MQTTGALRRVILIVTAAILLMQGIATWHMTERARDAQTAAAEETVNRIARTMEAAVNRAFVQVDAVLAGLPALLGAFWRDGALDIVAGNRLLRELTNQNLIFRDVLLIGADGMPLAAAQPLSRRRRLNIPSDSAFVEVGSRGGTVSVAGPLVNPATGEWSLYFARGVTIQGLGPVMAVAEVPLHQVQALLSSGTDSPGIRMTLEREDGTLLASLPHDQARIGQRLYPASAILRGGGSPGNFASRFTGRAAMFAVRPTLYSGLSVSASIETDLALAGWAADRRQAAFLSGAIAVLLLTVALALNEFLRNRDRVETERAEARRLIENAIESMTDGFVMFDAEDRLVTCNSRYRDFFHLSSEAIVPGSHYIDILRAGAARGQFKDIRPDLETWLRDRFAWHRGNNPPMEQLLPDGRWILITDRRTPDGGTVGIRTDITVLKQAMAALSAARDEAAEAAAAKSRFLARMSHELRTPLNGVLGFAQVLLQDARLTGDQRQRIRTMHEAGTHLLHLVNSLLDLAKIDAGRLELETRETEVMALLEGCAALLRPEIDRKGIAFAIDPGPTLPRVVQADPTRLRQLLLNLLSNAVKFTPPGGRVALRVRAMDGGGLRFEVEDSGPGVPEDKRHLLFQDFVQLGTTIAGNALGTGLGLSISARLATLMGGRIGCGGETGGGALFWVELPLISVDLLSAAAAVTLAAPYPAADPPDAPWAKLRVLVVDDIKANRDVAQAMLEGVGHDVSVVADGPSAIAAVQCELFDVVLMDVHMPGMDGLEATRRIRALPAPAGQMPILALTASVQAEQVTACRGAGMDGLLEKPIDRTRMLTVLAETARSHPMPTAMPADTPAEDEAQPGRVLIDAAQIARLNSELGAAAPEIIAEFVGELRRAAGLLAEASFEERTDPARVKALAHRLLGAARTLGAVALAAEAEALQKAAQAGDPAPALQTRAIATTEATLAVLVGVDAAHTRHVADTEAA